MDDEEPGGPDSPVGSPDESPDDLERYAGSPPAGVRVLRAIRIPGVLLLIGVALLVVGPLPGLGVFLVIGASLATFVIGMTAWVGA